MGNGQIYFLTLQKTDAQLINLNLVVPEEWGWKNVCSEDYPEDGTICHLLGSLQNSPDPFGIGQGPLQDPFVPKPL